MVVVTHRKSLGKGNQSVPSKVSILDLEGLCFNFISIYVPMRWQWRGSFMGPVLGVRTVLICIFLKQATSISSSTVKNRAMQLEMWDLWGVSYEEPRHQAWCGNSFFLGRYLGVMGKWALGTWT